MVSGSGMSVSHVMSADWYENESHDMWGGGGGGGCKGG